MIPSIWRRSPNCRRLTEGPEGEITTPPLPQDILDLSRLGHLAELGLLEIQFENRTDVQARLQIQGGFSKTNTAILWVFSSWICIRSSLVWVA